MDVLLRLGTRRECGEAHLCKGCAPRTHWHTPCIAARINGNDVHYAMTIELAADDIRSRAYALWEARGRPYGDGCEDWLEAERQLRAELDAVSTPLEPLAAEAADVLEAGVVPRKDNGRSPDRPPDQQKEISGWNASRR